MTVWEHPGPGARAEWFALLKDVGFLFWEKLWGYRDPTACERWRFRAGVGRPARGQRFSDHLGCGSKSCPECQEGKRVVGVQQQTKARLRAFELAFQRKFGVKRPLRYVVATLTPPTEPDVWFHFLASRGLEDVDETAADLLLPRLVASRHPTRFSENGIYAKVFGDGRLNCAHKIWRAAIKELTGLAERAVKRSLDAILEVDRRDTKAETRYGMDISVHLMSEHGFYPHVAIIIPEYYQIKQNGRWEWKLLPECLFREIVVKCKICQDHTLDRFMPFRDLLQVIWSGSAESAGREQWKDKINLWELARGYDPGTKAGADVRIVTGDLEAAVNYQFSWVLTKTYRRLLRDPSAVVAREPVRQAVRQIMRYVVMPRAGPRLVRHTGLFASRVLGRTYASLSGRRPRPDSHGRIAWRDVLARLQARFKMSDDLTRDEIRKLVAEMWDRQERDDHAGAAGVWRSIERLVSRVRGCRPKRRRRNES